MAKQFVALYATDLHGRVAHFERVLARGRKEGAKAVIFGGDICPKRLFFRLKDDGSIFIPSEIARGGSDRSVMWAKSFLVMHERNERAKEKAKGGGLEHRGLEHGGRAGRIGLSAEGRSAGSIEAALGVSDGACGCELAGVSLRDIADEIRGLGFLEKRVDWAAPVGVGAGIRGWLEKRVLPLLRGKFEGAKNLGIGELLLLIAPESVVESGVIDAAQADAVWKKAEAILHEAREKGSRAKTFGEVIIGVMRELAIELNALTGKLLEMEADHMLIAEAQRRFVADRLLPLVGEFSRSNRIDVYIMPGNDDSLPVLDLLNEGEERGILNQMHGKVHELAEGISIAGYSNVSVLPEHVMGDWLKSEKEIAADLGHLASLSDPRKTIYSIHAPPHWTALDVFVGEGGGMAHGGSEAVLEFIREKQPLLALHGHIHEAPEVSRRFTLKIGETLAVQPGAPQEDTVPAVLFDLADLKRLKRIALRQG